MDKIILENNIFFVNKDIFQDDYEHYYSVECYNGYGIATNADDTDVNAPHKLKLIYPKLEDVLSDDNLCKDILIYRGLYDKDKSILHYGDIMLYFSSECDNISIFEH